MWHLSPVKTHSVYGVRIVTEAWKSFKRKPKHANFITVIETFNFPSFHRKEGENIMNTEV